MSKQETLNVGRPKNVDYKHEEVFKLNSEGFNAGEIAELLDMPTHRVRYTLWQHRVTNGTVVPTSAKRWLKPKNVKLPWTRVPNRRGKNGLVLCHKVSGTQAESDAKLVEISNRLKQEMKDKRIEDGKQHRARRKELNAQIAAIAAEHKQEQGTQDMVNHPPHYTKGGVEVIDFIEAKKLGYNLGNVVKYVSRVDDKDDPIENLRKAEWYLKREIARREVGNES